MIYKTRYHAMKAKREGAFYNGADIVVKVEGGYKLMTAEDYRTWRKQK